MNCIAVFETSKFDKFERIWNQTHGLKVLEEIDQNDESCDKKHPCHVSEKIDEAHPLRQKAEKQVLVIIRVSLARITCSIGIR